MCYWKGVYILVYCDIDKGPRQMIVQSLIPSPKGCTIIDQNNEFQLKKDRCYKLLRILWNSNLSDEKIFGLAASAAMVEFCAISYLIHSSIEHIAVAYKKCCILDTNFYHFDHAFTIL